jgi:voltage-gated potassium channel
MMSSIEPRTSLRERVHTVIFEADTPAGKAFDIVSMICILASVAAVVLESMEPIRKIYGDWLRTAEWTFTAIFSADYVARLLVVRRPLTYARSFFGVVDLMSVLPSFLSLLVPGAQSLLVIRALRLLRVFRVLKLAHFLDQANVLTVALRSSRPKILVFLGTIMIVTLIMGSAMYVIEGAASGFTNIPRGVYWAIVTLTTVGYGDLYPQTDLGRLLASVVMVMGYAIIAVPTGIVTAELGAAMRKPISTQACPTCVAQGHDIDARHCKYCGSKL